MSNDLKHSDWLLISTEQILKTIDNNLVILKQGNSITVSQIKEDVIDKLVFLTNSDTNNNFLGLQSMQLFLDGQPKSDTETDISLTSYVKQLWTRSDLVGYLEEKRLHKPFDVSNLDNAPSFTGTTFAEYTDLITGSKGGVGNSVGRKKTYTIVIASGMDK